MRFALSEEQRSFAKTLDGLLAGADVPATNRAWAVGDTGPGLALWRRLADLGVTALGVEEDLGGIGGTPLDLVVAFERLGYHGVPGPWVESVALAPTLLRGTEHQSVLGEVAQGTALVSIASPPQAPYALDAETAAYLFLADSRAQSTTLSVATTERALESIDPTRHLYVVKASGPATALTDGALQAGLELAALASAAFLVGAGERMLTEAVAYAGQRRQFGRVIGEFQAIKHALADVRVALDFARPMVQGAARELEHDATAAQRDVSAAKVIATDAALLAARAALQAHGAIGYTQECDLSIWILRSRALAGVWGTSATHRARVLQHLTRS